MGQEPFFHTRCAGKLSDRCGNSVEVNCLVTCSAEGDLGIAFDDLLMNSDTFWVLDAGDATESHHAQSLVLDARSEHQWSVTSSSVYLTSQGTKSNDTGDWIALTAMAVWLDVTALSEDIADDVGGLRAVYWTFGLRAHGVQTLQTYAGELKLRGRAGVVNFDTFTGFVQITAHAGFGTLAEWVEAADDACFDVLDMVSFAEGRLVRWGVRQIVRNDTIIARHFRGPHRTGRARRGFQHWLHLQPAVNLAPRYTKELKERTGINVSLEWTLMNPRYDELDFLACMTALEHLVATFRRHNKVSPQGQTSVKDKVLPAIRAAIKNVGTSASSPEETALIKKAVAKLGNLGAPTLLDVIREMMVAYGVPLRGIEDDLPGLIDLRNEIVHRGIAREEFRPHLRRSIDSIRELLTRTFLALLQYRGNYDSYLTGSEQHLSFPDLDPAH